MTWLRQRAHTIAVMVLLTLVLLARCAVPVQSAPVHAAKTTDTQEPAR